jgi:AcrR family transcriptional regulator
MSTTVIVYDGRMGRWEPDARGRLAKAALELYSQQGFDQTTVEEIARQAGLTERTFFRHFADKREVLFWGAAALETELLAGLDVAPTSAGAFDLVAAAVGVIAADFEPRREFARRRQLIINANAELQERERIKLASLASALGAALRRRGVGDTAAILAGEMGIAVFRVGFERWIDPSNRKTFADIVRDSFEELKLVVASPPGGGAYLSDGE